ncbi:MAG: hypothetical protein E2600_05505 [Chryseobacterium sp.]|nr:hypothetical protein [Chryseobacterium sp.]
MGKLYDSLLSGTSGRTGRIVVANVYGNEITRTRPRKRNAQPTAKQLLIQNRMKRCAEFMQSYKGYACRHFGNRSGMRSCYNLAMTNLMENFKIDYAASSITPDYPALAFSKGVLLAAIPLSIKLSGDKLDITWQDNSAGNVDRENDLAQILLAAEGENFTFFIENAAIRSEATYSAIVPINFQEKTLHVWMAFRSNDEQTVSSSQYIGTTA